MVKTINVLATAFMVSAVTAFTPTLPLSNSIAPARPATPLHATATVLDKPSILESPSTTATPLEQRRSSSTDNEMNPNGDYLLRIYNDSINTREYVAVCLVQVVSLCESRAYYTMQDAHHNGIAKVGEYNQEVAECYEELLNERGIMCDVVEASGWE